MKWFQRFAESLNNHVGKEEGKILAKGWEDLPTGAGKHAKEQRTRWIKSTMENLDELVDEKTRNRILIDACPHSYPKTRIKLMKAEFERLGNLDELLELMRKDTSWGGGSFYDYPVRKGKVIYVTKVPFNPKAYKNAISEDEKRLAYCHCSLVKSSIDETSPTFCCCSGGWVKQLWEGIFDMPVEVTLSESLLNGNGRCTHAVGIPAKFL